MGFKSGFYTDPPQVYNVTEYLDDHPGGEAILLGVAGTDATSAFEDAGHSDDARETLVKFAIGVVPTSVCNLSAISASTQTC